MQENDTKINKAWKILFERHRIRECVDAEGTFRISSAQINEVCEARLMAKFDKSANLPEIFRKNELSILPVTRGTYLIGHFDTHKKIDYKPIKPILIKNAPLLETLDAQNLYSEASALLFAYHSGIIKDIMNCDKVYFTVSGRMGSEKFSFSINNNMNPLSPIHIDVINSQIEIDAGFESSDAFIVCEAKNQAPDEILIRQLYYPYRLWSNKIKKLVIPMFLAFSNDIFHVFIYEFTDSQDYNSIEPKIYKAYTFADEDIPLQDIIDLWHTTKVIAEPNVTFPQADSFERILDLLSVLHEEELTHNEVTLKYEFDPRQTDYYITACEYLGLVERNKTEKNEHEYRLTVEARKIMSWSPKKKRLELMKKILERPVFNNAFKIFMDNNELPDKQSICSIMKSVNFSKPINETTIWRRSSTVLGWLNWIIKESSVTE
jgi:hypothetical protein